mmetsp:Transcript_60143/g.167813  ORF Transcript_60143/g.167813 Transcript_60143/m.167813 type:complete len:251 (+) Transcript_60143:133-885(+)
MLLGAASAPAAAAGAGATQACLVSSPIPATERVAEAEGAARAGDVATSGSRPRHQSRWPLSAALSSTRPQCRRKGHRTRTARSLTTMRSTLVSASTAQARPDRSSHPWSMARRCRRETRCRSDRWRRTTARASRCSRRWASKAEASGSARTVLRTPLRSSSERRGRACKTMGKWRSRTCMEPSTSAIAAPSKSFCRGSPPTKTGRSPVRVGRRVTAQSGRRSCTRPPRRWRRPPRRASRASASWTCEGQR